MDRPKATASELFFHQIDRLLSGRMLCSEHRGRLLAFHVSALFEVGVAACLILCPASFAFRPLDLEDQIIFTHFNLDVLVCVEEDPGELASKRRLFAVVIDLRYFSRCILEYNLSSLVECDAEVLTAEPGTAFAQEDIADLWITSEHKTFLSTDSRI